MPNRPDYLSSSEDFSNQLAESLLLSDGFISEHLLHALRFNDYWPLFRELAIKHLSDKSFAATFKKIIYSQPHREEIFLNLQKTELVFKAFHQIKNLPPEDLEQLLHSFSSINGKIFKILPWSTADRPHVFEWFMEVQKKAFVFENIFPDENFLIYVITHPNLENFVKTVNPEKLFNLPGIIYKANNNTFVKHMIMILLNHPELVDIFMLNNHNRKASWHVRFEYLEQVIQALGRDQVTQQQIFEYLRQQALEGSIIDHIPELKRAFAEASTSQSEDEIARLVCELYMRISPEDIQKIRNHISKHRELPAFKEAKEADQNTLDLIRAYEQESHLISAFYPTFGMEVETLLCQFPFIDKFSKDMKAYFVHLIFCQLNIALGLKLGSGQEIEHAFPFTRHPLTGKYLIKKYMDAGLIDLKQNKYHQNLPSIHYNYEHKHILYPMFVVLTRLFEYSTFTYKPNHNDYSNIHMLNIKANKDNFVRREAKSGDLLTQEGVETAAEMLPTLAAGFSILGKVLDNRLRFYESIYDITEAEIENADYTATEKQLALITLHLCRSFFRGMNQLSILYPDANFSNALDEKVISTTINPIFEMLLEVFPTEFSQMDPDRIYVELEHQKIVLNGYEYPNLVYFIRSIMLEAAQEITQAIDRYEEELCYALYQYQRSDSENPKEDRKQIVQFIRQLIPDLHIQKKIIKPLDDISDHEFIQLVARDLHEIAWIKYQLDLSACLEIWE